MSSMSFGMVFTSGRLEVWKIGKENSKNEYYQEQIKLVDTETINGQFLSTASKLGFSQDGNAKLEIFGVYVPDNLKKALVCGITRDGSLKAAERLARSLLFSPEVFYSDGDFNSTVKDSSCEVVVISGGFDDSDDTKINKLISDIAESEWFKKRKPKVIYAGNRDSVSVAQLKFSPFTDFYEMRNVLENDFSGNDFNSLLKLDVGNSFPFSIKGSLLEKVKFSTYQKSIRSLSKYLCGSNSGRVVSAMVTDNYTILNQCRLEAGKPVIENIAFSKNAEDLSPDDFSSSYTEFSVGNSMTGDIFTAEDILPIGKKKHENFFRPDRIIGISLSEVVNIKKFLDLISDPDIVRGIVEYFFDNTGFFLMCGSVLSSDIPKKREKTDRIIEDHDINSGWLVIPDGDFIKDEIALEVYIGGDENDKTSQLFWGKRYVIPIKEDSVIELRFKGSAFLIGKGPVVVLRTGNRPGNLVVDIRKEKS